jgi:hypothetical protein
LVLRVIFSSFRRLLEYGPDVPGVLAANSGADPVPFLTVQFCHQGTIDGAGGVQICGQYRELLLQVMDLLGCFAGCRDRAAFWSASSWTCMP